jgi:gliding motility-associated protein GldM
MGAVNCPETPRQKMIGMMYLFYTALLALNVSKDILNSFAIVNDGLQKTNINFTIQNGFTYDAFTVANNNDPIKTAPYYEAAKKAKTYTDSMFNYVQGLKVQIVQGCDNIPKEEAEKATEDLNLFEAKDQRDYPTHFMIGEVEDGSKGEARKLKEKLIDYRNKLLDLFSNPKIKLQYKDKLVKGLGNLGINTDNNPNALTPEERNWELAKFAEIPAIASVTILSQIQNQIKNAEAVTIKTLLSAIGSTNFKMDTVAPRVIPKSNYLISGDKYNAELFIAAFSSTDTVSQVLIGDSYDSIHGKLLGNIKTLKMQRGVAHYDVDGAGVGSHTYAAIIKVFNASTGQFTEVPVKSGGKYSIEYTVAPPMAVVSPTKMNVLYIGVDNPMEISVPGFRDDQISAVCAGGSLSRSGKGAWVAKVTKLGTTKISVSVKDDKGGSRSMGTKEFRVKRIPDPVPTIGTKKGGSIPKSILIAQGAVSATLENFDFDLKFNVTEFTISSTIGGFNKSASVKGSRFSPEMIGLINQVQRGKKIYIEDVKAVGPDGTVRNLPAIVFKME